MWCVLTFQIQLASKLRVKRLVVIAAWAPAVHTDPCTSKDHWPDGAAVEHCNLRREEEETHRQLLVLQTT